MLAKCNCQSCGGGIEFDVEQTGASIECPHCQQPTLLRAAFRPASRSPGKNGKLIAWYIGIIGGVLVLIVGLSLYLHILTPLDVAAGTGGGLMFIIVAIGGILLFVLAIFWLIFPWMVYGQMKRINASLEKIEINTEK